MSFVSAYALYNIISTPLPPKKHKIHQSFWVLIWLWCIWNMCSLLCKSSSILFPIQCLSLIAALSPTTDLNLTQCLELYIQFLLRPCSNSITSLYFYYDIFQIDLYSPLVCCVSVKICIPMDLYGDYSMIFNYHFIQHIIIYEYLVLAYWVDCNKNVYIFPPLIYHSRCFLFHYKN